MLGGTVKSFFQKSHRILIALFFSAVGLYWRYRELAGRDLWADELCQLQNTIGPFKPIWQRLTLGELTCFPGEYLLNYLFVRFWETNKWVINIPHYVATLLGFYFLYLVCRKYLKTWVGFTVAFLVFCFNGNLIFHAFEFRPYAVLPTLSLASFYLAGKIIMEGQSLASSKKIIIGVFFIFLVIYHAYGAIIAGLCFLYFICAAARTQTYRVVLRNSFPFLFPVGTLGLAVFLWYASGGIVNWEHCQARGINTFDVFPNPADDFNHFMRQLFANLLGNKKYGEKLLGLGIWISFLLPQKDRWRQMGFFLLLIILPVELILLSDLQGGYWFLDRQFVWVMSLYAFFLGWCWDSIVIFVQAKLRTRT